MKTIWKSLLTLLLPTLLWLNANAQDCKNLAFEQGASYEMENYDSKNKKTGASKSKVKEVTVSGDKKTALIHSETYDSKDKKGEELDFKMICEGGKIMIDLSPMASMMANQMKGMEVRMETSFVEIPSDLKVGQTLPDGKMIMKIIDQSSGQEFATTTITISDRKVEGKETITTPAGTFETWKISSMVKVETMMAMGMKMPGGVNVKNIEYFSKEVGTVRSEQVNKKGEIESYSVLTKYTKP